METGFCDILNGRLYYTKRGSGAPIVFIHGFGLDLRMWKSQAEYFSNHFTCITVDLRGFGKSSVPTDIPYAHHEDVNALLEFLQVEWPVILVGLSLGARVVANFGLAYPEKISAAVFVDAAIDGYLFKYFDLSSTYDAGKKAGVQAANKMWLEHPLFYPARKSQAVFDQLTEIMMSYSGWHWIHKNPIKILDPPAIEQLQNLHMPALIITGDQDMPDFQDIAVVLSKRIPNAVKAVIPDAGHMSNMEQPESFNELVLQFCLLSVPS